MVNPRMNSLLVLRKYIEETEPDILRALMHGAIQQIMSAEADEKCGADYGKRTSERSNRRNGYRRRDLDTRLGTISLAIPRLREGTYFPDWLLLRRRRAERALITVIVEAYIMGVSTRKMEKLLAALGVNSLSKSQVSEMTKELDQMVAEFRNRPLTEECPYVWVDALAIRCREGGRVCNVSVMIATAVNSNGQRQILGMDISTSEDEAGWKAFLRGLNERGLSGVRLVISDAHKGLKAAIASEMPGVSWQRCRTHFARNLLCKVPKSKQGHVAAALRAVFAQPTKKDAREALHKLADELKRYPDAKRTLEEAEEDILAYADFPEVHWKKIWSNNPQERLNREIRRRTNVVGIFPNRESIIRLVGALLCEQNEEWMVTKAYMSKESLALAIQPPKIKEESLIEELVPLQDAVA